VIVNIARRAHDHNWELDPITRSLLDTDFYKLLMLQFIWKHFPNTRATFSLQNRTTAVRLGEIIELHELREQLEEARKLRFHKSELIWLAGNTFYGRRGMFEPAFLEWLDVDFRLSDFDLSVEDGQISLRFDGLWTETTMWEIYSLAIIDELKTRASLKKLTEFELDILYARAKTRLWEKMERLRGVPGLSLSDFGTRRRHSFLWHEYVVKAMSDVLEANFAGSSNTYLAYKHDLEAIGTNAHELPMALTALAETDEEMRDAQYRFLELWQQTYQGELLILLPDTFGTTQFLRDAPDWVADWTGQRVDSKDPFVAGDEYIQWLEQHGRDPRRKRLIASDALDVIAFSPSMLISEEPFGTARARRIFAHRRTFAMPGSGSRIGVSDSPAAGVRFSPTISATAIRAETRASIQSVSCASFPRWRAARQSNSPTIMRRPWGRPRRSTATAAFSEPRA